MLTIYKKSLGATMKLICTLILFLSFCTSALAEPYGPTIIQVINKYPITRSFDNLKEIFSIESLPIRLGMTERDVRQIVKRSFNYRIEYVKNSKIHISNDKRNIEPYETVSIIVWLRKGIVITIEIGGVIGSNELSENDFYGLKALKPMRKDECWVHQNFVDVNSMNNGFDFVFSQYRMIPEDEDNPCMGHGGTSIIIGKPGLLYPKHVRR